MKYRELYDEYMGLLHSRTELYRQLQDVPRGYISTKKISGKEYSYLQYTSFGKKKSRYLSESEAEVVREKLALGKTLHQELEDNCAALERLEKAVKILDEQLSRAFFFLRQCADMDAVPISKREKTLSFSKAMTALEGLPAQRATEENLRLWAEGETLFADFYLPILQKYKVMEVSR